MGRLLAQFAEAHHVGLTSDTGKICNSNALSVHNGRPQSPQSDYPWPDLPSDSSRLGWPWACSARDACLESFQFSVSCCSRVPRRLVALQRARGAAVLSELVAVLLALSEVALPAGAAPQVDKREAVARLGVEPGHPLAAMSHPKAAASTARRSNTAWLQAAQRLR